MACCSRSLFRIGLVGALVLGVGVAVAGPERIKALFAQTRESINAKIDENITDPVALRAQLKDLESQYPKRLAEVRGDLAKLREQVAQLNRDLSVSNRVVQMAESDSQKLSAAIDQGRVASIQSASVETGETTRAVLIVFKNEKIDLSTAETRRNQIDATRNAYASRAADIQRDLGYLGQQERQLVSLVTRLETEYTSFQTQVFDLDRQIDAIGRNDRMIAIMKDRQGTLEEQSRYRAASLDAIQTKLADIRARQEATLQTLAKSTERYGYEQDAKAALDREAAQGIKPEQAMPTRQGPKALEIDAERAAQEQSIQGPNAVGPQSPAAADSKSPDSKVSMR